MAHTIHAPAHLGLGDRIKSLFASVKAAYARDASYRRTVRELSALSNRDLADLGISRGEIKYLAHEAAYGA